MPETDEVLIAQWRSGDAGAFDELAKAHGRDIFVLALGVLGDAEDAQDVTQDVLIALYRSLGRLRDAQALPAWLARVCINRCRALRRGRRPAESLGDREIASDGAGPAERLVSAEMRIALRQAVVRLPQRQQAAFVLRHFGGRSTDEIARALGCAPATVRVHLSRAVAHLRAALAGKGEYDG